VPVPYFLLFLCFRKVTQEIFSELDKTKAKHPENYRSFQKSEEETERGHGPATVGLRGPALAAPPMCVTTLVHFWRCPIAVARWLSSPPCASCLDLVSCLTWSRSLLCNSTCCVCCDPMNIGVMLSWCAESYILCYLYVVYDLACSPLSVAILAK
jgi:hypothetical protein